MWASIPWFIGQFSRRWKTNAMPQEKLLGDSGGNPAFAGAFATA